jgi:hypothetical protein
MNDALRQIGCFYSLHSRRSIDPRQKSRLLEFQLGRFRHLLSEIQKENRSMTQEETCAALETLENGLIGSRSSHEDDEHTDSTKLDSMMSTYGRVAYDSPWEPKFYGAPSGLAFLHRTEEFFNPRGELADDWDSTKSVISQLFDAPLPNDPPGGANNFPTVQLPHKEKVSAMLITLFRATYLVFPILHEPTFYQDVDRLYTKDPIEYDEADRAFLPLFHLTLALGYLFSRDSHQNYGCQKAVTEA